MKRQPYLEELEFIIRMVGLDDDKRAKEIKRRRPRKAIAMMIDYYSQNKKEMKELYTMYHKERARRKEDGGHGKRWAELSQERCFLVAQNFLAKWHEALTGSGEEAADGLDPAAAGEVPGFAGHGAAAVDELLSACAQVNPGECAVADVVPEGSGPVDGRAGAAPGMVPA